MTNSGPESIVISLTRNRKFHFFQQYGVALKEVLLTIDLLRRLGETRGVLFSSHSPARSFSSGQHRPRSRFSSASHSLGLGGGSALATQSGDWISPTTSPTDMQGLGHTNRVQDDLDTGQKGCQAGLFPCARASGTSPARTEFRLSARCFARWSVRISVRLNGAWEYHSQASWLLVSQSSCRGDSHP